jgi:tetratricopeptide (TPR) repeat protein
LQKAIDDYSQAILVNPLYALAYGNRGEIWRLTGDFDRSLIDLNKAAELAPKDPMILTMRGETLRDRGQFEQALKDFDKALEISPDGAVVYTDRALTLEKMGDLARAHADFKKALSLPSAKDPATTRTAQETARARLAALEAKLSEENAVVELRFDSAFGPLFETAP